jgi:hypothetical protein
MARRDRLGLRPVADHHVHLEVAVAPRHLRDGAATGETLERPAAQLQRAQREEARRADRVAPADHDDDRAVRRDPVGRDEAVALRRAHPIGADHEERLGIRGGRLARVRHLRPADRKPELDAATARDLGREAARSARHECDSDDGRRRQRNQQSSPSASHVLAHGTRFVSKGKNAG